MHLYVKSSSEDKVWQSYAYMFILIAFRDAMIDSSDLIFYRKQYVQFTDNKPKYEMYRSNMLLTRTQNQFRILYLRNNIKPAISFMCMIIKKKNINKPFLVTPRIKLGTVSVALMLFYGFATINMLRHAYLSQFRTVSLGKKAHDRVQNCARFAGYM